MAIITGTASITNNTKAVTVNTIDDSQVLVGTVSVGDLFQFVGENSFFHVEVAPVSNSALTLFETFGGTTKTAQEFQILTGFLGNDLLRIDPSMQDAFYAINRNFEQVSDLLSAIGSTSDTTQIITKVFIGVPAQGLFWGYHKFTASVEIDKILVSQQDNAVTDTNLVLDIEINGVLQGLNLTVPAGSSSDISTSLAYTVNAGEVVRLKWITASEPCPSNWDIDIHYHSVNAPRIYYDFQRDVIGDLFVGKIIGSNYYPPNKGKVFGISYEFTMPPEGSAVILELLKDGSSLGTPVLITLPALTNSGYLDITQTEFLTANTCSLKVNQIGSIVPGSNLKTILHSYHTI